MTVREVAFACGVTSDTVRRWVRDGRLPAMRIGGSDTAPRYAIPETALGDDSKVRAAIAAARELGARNTPGGEGVTGCTQRSTPKTP